MSAMGAHDMPSPVTVHVPEKPIRKIILCALLIVAAMTVIPPTRDRMLRIRSRAPPVPAGAAHPVVATKEGGVGQGLREIIFGAGKLLIP